VPFGSNAEILATKVVKHKGIHAGVIAAQGTLPSLIGDRLLFYVLAASGDIVLVLATLATELALSPRKSIVTQMPVTSLCHSRPLCLLSYRGA
jgi:hypothetical protein